MIEPTAESAHRADPRPDFEPPPPADTAGITLLGDRERFIQQIAELTPAVLTVVDLKMGHHAYISRDVVILHGYTLDEIAQMKDPSFELLHPEDVPRVKENFNRLQRATDVEINECEYRVRHRNGEWRWLSSRSMPFARNENGDVEHVVSATVDITPRKRAEEDLRRAHEELEHRVDERTQQLSALNEGLRIQIAERELAQAAARAATEELRVELEARNRLYELGTRLLTTDGLQSLLEEVLDAAIDLQHADFGNVQVWNPQTKALEIVAQRGFGREFLDYFSAVDEDGAAFGRAMHRRERLIIEDVQSDPGFEPHRHIAAGAGFRAVQSTPVVSRDGELLGMLSTHFRDPHRPSDRELRLTDLYVLHTAEMFERNRRERLLEEANEKVELVLDSITDNAFGFSKDWRYTYLNKHAAQQIRMLGKDPARLIGRTLWEEFPHLPNEETFRRVMSERVAITDELYYEPLGEWVENHVYPTRDGGFVTFQKYITGRKRAEEQLRRSEAYLVEAERLSHTGSWAWNVASGELFWSHEHFRICGVDPESFKPTLDSARQLIHPDDLAYADQVFSSAIQTRRGFDHDLRFVRPDGTVRYVHSLAHPSFDESGNVSEYVGTVMDITERREEEKARKELLRRLVVAQEEERRRISRELHDELGQQLSALKLNLAAFRRQHGWRGDVDDAVASLEAMARQLDSDVDFIVWQLRPTALDDLGLATALTKYVADWSEHFHVQSQLHLSGIKGGRLTDEEETALYRLSQEALNNVAKHAQATRVQILLEARLDHTSLIVEDDGQGFDAGQAFDMARKGLGLIGMRERAALLGGTLAVESSQGRGTTVVARIPAPRPASGKVT